MSSIKKNYIYNVGYQLLQFVVPLLTAPYLARVLGAEGVGIYSYTNSIASYFVLFGMLGITNHGSRAIAMVRDDSSARNQMFCKIYNIQKVSAGIVLAVYLLYILLLADKYRWYSVLQIFYVLSALFDITWLFNGIENFKITTIRNCAVKLISVCTIFAFVRNSSDVWIYVTIMSGSFLISQLIMWTQIRKYISFVKVPFRASVEELKPIFTLFVPIIAYTIYRIMDKIMLGSITGDMVQMGWYENAEKIISIPVGLITALGTVMLPRMSNLAALNDNSGANSMIENSFVFSTIIAFSTGCGLIAIGNELAPVLFGNEFLGCGTLIVLLSISIPFVAWANIIRTQYLIPNKRDSVYLLSTSTGAVVNLAFNIALIPIYGAVGAVIGSILAEASVFIIQVVKVNKELPICSLLRNSMPYIIFGVIMGISVKGVISILPSNVFGLCVSVIMGILLYAVMLFTYSLHSSDFIGNFIRSKFRRKEK